MITHFFFYPATLFLKILACINKRTHQKQQQGNHRRGSLGAVFGVNEGELNSLLSVLSPNYDIHGCSKWVLLKIKPLLSL